MSSVLSSHLNFRSTVAGIAIDIFCSLSFGKNVDWEVLEIAAANSLDKSFSEQPIRTDLDVSKTERVVDNFTL